MHRSLYFLFLFPALAIARLGETEQQLIARFGAPISRGKESMIAQGKIVEFGSRLVFREADWRIECTIIDERSVREVYHKKGEWTEDHFAVVLNSNSQSAKWKDVTKSSVRKLTREWRRDDGGSAVWKMGSTMIVEHPGFQRAKNTAEAKAKADARRIPKI